MSFYELSEGLSKRLAKSEHRKNEQHKLTCHKLLKHDKLI